MRPRRPEHSERGRARLEFAPDLELSLPETHRLAALIDGWAGVKGVTVHWRADAGSPEVAVQASHAEYESALDALLGEVGGFGRLGTLEDSFAERPEQRRGRVLVVTPNDAIREIAVMYLAVMGLEVEDVTSAREAHVRIREREYDLLLIGNSDLGDNDVVGLLAAVEQFLDMTTPVIFWTGDHPSEAVGPVGHVRVPLMVISKPNDFRGFRERVMHALEWRHLIRLRRRVRERVEELVAERMQALTRDLMGAPAGAAS